MIDLAWSTNTLNQPLPEVIDDPPSPSGTSLPSEYLEPRQRERAEGCVRRLELNGGDVSFGVRNFFDIEFCLGIRTVMVQMSDNAVTIIVRAYDVECRCCPCLDRLARQ